MNTPSRGAQITLKLAKAHMLHSKAGEEYYRHLQSCGSHSRGDIMDSTFIRMGIYMSISSVAKYPATT